MNESRKARDIALLDALDKFERTAFEGTAWRVVRESRDVLQASPVGARWDPGTFDVLYTSLDREGGVEEIYFHLSRQPVFPATPFRLHRLQARATGVLRLDDLDLLKQLGIDTGNYASLDYSRTQAIGDAAFFLGFGGMVVPSARYSCMNLILFPDRLEVAALNVEHSEAIDWIAWRRAR